MGPGSILVSDIDGTLLGNADALDRFAGWLATRRDGYRLVYASGRSRTSLERLIAETALPEPDALISSVGSELHRGDGRSWPGWDGRLEEWPAARVRETLAAAPRLRVQPAHAQSRRKASFDAPGLRPADLADVRRRLRAAGLEANVLYSASRFLDVLPPAAGKGAAARVIAGDWGLRPTDVLVFGDSGNDVQLFEQGFRGTIVANALPELRAAVGPATYRSPFAHADGVLDGIRHWTTS